MSKTYACSVIGCGKSYNQPHHLKVHAQMKHGNIEDLPHKCQLEGCNQRYIDERSVLRHVNICRTRHPKLRSVTKSRTELDRMTVEERQIYNQIHEDTRKALKAEQNCSETVKCSHCGEFFLRSDLSQHYKQMHNGVKIADNQYECKLCGLTFGSKQSRDYHMNAKHVDYNNRRHACTHPDCTFRAADSSNLNKHMKACKHNPTNQAAAKIRSVSTQTEEKYEEEVENSDQSIEEDDSPVSSLSANLPEEISLIGRSMENKDMQDIPTIEEVKVFPEHSRQVPNHVNVSYAQVVDDNSTSVSKTVFLTEKSEVYHNAGCRILLDQDGKQREFRSSIKVVTVDGALAMNKKRCRYCRNVIFAREDAVPVMRGNAVRLGSIISEQPTTDVTNFWVATSVNVLHKHVDCAKSLDGLVRSANDSDVSSLTKCSKCILAQSVYTPEEMKARRAAKEKRRRENMNEEQKENERKRKRLARLSKQ